MSTIDLYQKKALILHGLGGHSKENWFDWLGKELEKRDYNVWAPDLPDAHKPNITTIKNFLQSRHNWNFDLKTILIGRSAGAVAILGLLQELPESIKVDTCYLVGSFKDDLSWPELQELFLKPFDFKKIKSHAIHFVFIHSDNDPYCPLDHAQYLSGLLDGELIILNDQKHFSIGTMGDKYKKFPFLLKRIINNSIS